MAALDVDGLIFTFPDTWQASKFDEWSFYRHHFMTLRDNLQAVDILVLSPEKVAFLVEVKDYRHPDAGKPSKLAETIVNKVLCTLAALLPARLHAGTPLEEKNLSKAILGCKKLQVIVHIEQPSAHQPRVDLADLKQKLKSKLRAIDAHPKIVSMAKPLGMGWATSSTHTSIRRLVCKSVMNWGTVVQTWFRLISVVEHEQGIRHGAIPCRYPDRVAFHAPVSPPPSKGHSSSDRQTLAHRQPMGLAAKTSSHGF